jgi:hypothetical protein
MAKRKRTMAPCRAAVLLALLASVSNQTLLAALTVGSLNTALVSSASAETCVTGVNPTFANAVNDVSGQPGATVVTGVTPTTASALTNVTANPGAVPFLTSATLNQATGTASSVTSTTGTVTGITPTPGAPTNLFVPAFAPNFPTMGTNPPPPPHRHHHHHLRYRIFFNR